jgi:hypothetical protein
MCRPILRQGQGGKAAFFPPAQPPRRAEHEYQAHQLNRQHRREDLHRGNVQRRAGAQRRPGPGQEIDPGGKRGAAGQHAAVHAQLIVKRQHRRHGDQEADRARAIEMDEQGQQGRAHGDPRRLAPHQAQHSANQWRQQASIADHPEKQDGKHEHAGNRRNLGDAGQDPARHAGAQAQRRSANHRHQDHRCERG